MQLFVALKVLSLIVGVANGGVSMHNPFFCYSTDPVRSMTHKMGLLTSYEATRRFNFTTVDPFTPSGIPSRFWYLGREAAVFPDSEYIEEMINFAASSVQDDIVSNYDAGRSSLCRLDLEAIRNFNSDDHEGLTVANGRTVIETGVIAMQNVARRFQETFPNILTQNYSFDRYHFRHTNTERTNTSIRAFARGLFGEAGSQNVIYEDVPDFDWLLRPIDFCPAFSEELADADAQDNAFTVGPEMEEMVKQVNRKLGFHASNQLSFNQIFTMWTWCRYETYESFEISNSETGGNATWCAAFSLAHHNLLEYKIELQHFYRYGYGVRNQRLIENLNCGLMQDLLTHMQSNNNNDPMARIFVIHRQELLLFLTTLGAFRDVWPMHQHNFAQQSDRRFLTSMTVPLNANVVVVRYDSDDGDHDLVFLSNEKPMIIPGCDQHTGVCKMSVFVNRFERFINVNCEVLFCSNN